VILITGASGNVGSEVLKQAAEAKLNIRAAYLSAVKANGAPSGVQTVLFEDCTAPNGLRSRSTTWVGQC
jgi:uncharacterized protein YbjT (DUF2867 family)